MSLGGGTWPRTPQAKQRVRRVRGIFNQYVDYMTTYWTER